MAGGGGDSDMEGYPTECGDDWDGDDGNSGSVNSEYESEIQAEFIQCMQLGGLKLGSGSGLEGCGDDTSNTSNTPSTNTNSNSNSNSNSSAMDGVTASRRKLRLLMIEVCIRCVYVYVCVTYIYMYMGSSLVGCM